MANAWSITNTATGTSASFDVAAGDVNYVATKQTGVFYPLRGSSPFVVSGPTRVTTPKLPELITYTNTQYAALYAILTSGSRLKLTDDLGVESYVFVTGDVNVRVVDTPDRGAGVLHRYITVNFIGVS